MAKNLILFDLISTLTDSGPRYARAFADVCHQHGITPPDEDEVLGDLGNMNLKQIIDKYIGEMNDADLREFMGECNQQCDAMLDDKFWHEGLYPNVKGVLIQLQEADYALGIFTGTREEAATKLLAHHSLERYVDRRYVRGKNNERDGFIQKSSDLKSKQLQSIVGEFRKEHDGNVGHVVVVGDSVADMQAAKELGLIFVAFAHDEKKKVLFEAEGLEYIMTDFEQLPDILNRVSLSGAMPRPRSGPARKIVDRQGP